MSLYMLLALYHYLKLIFPKKSYRTLYKISRRKILPVNDDYEEDICIICLLPIKYKYLVYKTNCNHTFHKKCLHEWLCINKSCPICRNEDISLYLNFIIN